MKICAVICEYNPFHNGHKYQIEKIKEKYDRVICIMSGNFSQRAEPTIVDKYIRTEQALANGVDMILQLPTPYACASAKFFAMGAINILRNMPINAISFGMENPDINLLYEISKTQTTIEYQELLKKNLESGLSYATASSNTLSSILGDKVLSFLSTPNNILALEYINAIKHYKLEWEIFPIKRENNYNKTELDGEFASASTIRNAIENNIDYSQFVPNSSIIESAVKPNNILFENLALMQLKLGVNDVSKLADAGEGIENKLVKNAMIYPTLLQAQENTKSKRYTFARIKRLTLDNLLNITKEDYVFPDNATAIVLGFKKDFAPFLKEFSQYIITENSQLNKFVPSSFVSIEERAEIIYSALCGQEYKGIIKKLVKA